MKTSFIRSLLLAGIILICNSAQAQVNRFTIKSPDKKIAATLIRNNGTLQYQVLYNGKTVIAPSPLGLVINHKEISGSKALYPSKVIVINNSFPWRGVRSVAHHHATSTSIRVAADKIGEGFTMDVQVFNDGVAFRYRVPSKGWSKIARELTGFSVPQNSTAWWQGDIHNYEGEYKASKPASIKSGQTIGMPVTLELPGIGYAAITEANVNNFAGMHLVADGSSILHTALDGDVTLNGDVVTPWRVIIIGPDLNTLVNSDIIASLSPKADPKIFPKGFATEWIKPGKSVWSWMTATRAVTPENMRKFSDLASQCGIPYNLVDDGWGKWHEDGKDSWQVLKDLVDYSAKKHVRIWVWAAYPDNNGLPGLRDSAYMKSFLKKCHETGVAGVKIDFMSSESQELVAFYEHASREAAKLKLMIDFHGAGKPSGQSRTWPNELTREAVRGLEYSEDTDWPTHNTIIPFTRYLAGHGDYTPLSTAKFVSSTTLAHQVATMVTFTSPFLCLGVDPAELLKSEALPFVKSIPSIWDETVVLPQSAIGKMSVIARRSGTKWILAILNNKDARSISVRLSFLGTKSYTCKLLGDGKLVNKANGNKATGKDSFAVSLTSGDGLVAIFEPVATNKK